MPAAASLLFVCFLRFSTGTDIETAKNEDGVRMDGRLHGRDDQGHGIFLLSAVWRSHCSEPSGTTEEILFPGMPIQVEQHPPKTAELEDRAVKGLPDVRQRVFLPPPVRSSKKVLQSSLCQ